MNPPQPNPFAFLVALYVFAFVATLGVLTALAICGQ